MLDTVCGVRISVVLFALDAVEALGSFPKTFSGRSRPNEGDTTSRRRWLDLPLWSVGAVCQYYWGIVDAVCGVRTAVVRFAARGSMAREMTEIPISVISKQGD